MILRPAFLLKTAAASSLVPLYLEQLLRVYTLLYLLVFNPACLILVLAFTHLLHSLPLGALCLCSGSQILLLRVHLSTPPLWSSGFLLYDSISFPSPPALFCSVLLFQPCYCTHLLLRLLPTFENPTSLDLPLKHQCCVLAATKVWAVEKAN